MTTTYNVMIALDWVHAPLDARVETFRFRQDFDSSSADTGVVDRDFAENIFLWTLFVGCCVPPPPPLSSGSEEMTYTIQGSLEGSYHDFFIHGMRSYCVSRGIRDKDMVKAKLKDIVWLDGWCGSNFEQVWKDVLSYQCGLRPICP
jgi:hypothetical protein